MLLSTAAVQKSQTHPGMVLICVASREDPIFGHASHENRFVFKSLEYDKGVNQWDVAAPSTNQCERSAPRIFEFPVLIDAGKGESESAIFQMNSDNRAETSDKSTTELESNETSKLFEPLESPKENDEDQHRAWCEQRRYRAWIGARNLHID